MKNEKLDKRLPNDKSFPNLRIGQAARKLGVSTSLLRRYEILGLILPFKEGGGQRLFSVTDVEWLQSLKAYFATTGTGPSCLSRVMRSLPMREIRAREAGVACPLPPSVGICWQALPGARRVCRACPAYAEKSKVLTFDRHFRIEPIRP